MTAAKRRLCFVSPIFLFPADAGGKIRTTNILRGMKGGRFQVTLLSPATPEQEGRFAGEIGAACDRFVPWRARSRPKWSRGVDLLRRLPVNVVADRTGPALEAVRAAGAAGDCDVMVFDFAHAAVLRPRNLDCATVCFTHNVEAEIFSRHAEQAGTALMRRVWASQAAKMRCYEKDALGTFTTVIAVSDRDAQRFRADYGVPRVRTIPTGVDLDFFAWQPPPLVDPDHPGTVVFTGSMDSAANIGGVVFFVREVWPLVLRHDPRARFVVVGRNPPASLRLLARGTANVELTGSVEDVRPFVRRSHVFVIPLLVGGGTRIKAFEAMAMGCPVVSTGIGIEGLDVRPGADYLQCDDAQAMATAILALLADPARRVDLARRARAVVESRFGHAIAAQAFEQICWDTLAAHRSGRPGFIGSEAAQGV